MVLRLVRRLLRDLDKERLRRDLAAFCARHPDLPREELAARLVTHAARRCALAGALAAAPQGWFALALLAPDLTYLISQQIRLVLSLALLYGRDPNTPERALEVAGCVVLSLGAKLTQETFADWLSRGLSSEAVAAALKWAGAKATRRRSLGAIPLLGVAASGALNYAAVKAVGKLARDFYRDRTRQWRPSDLRALVPAKA